MLHNLLRRAGTTLALVALGLALVPRPGSAQRSPDFLFETPRATLGLNVGWAAPRAGSDIFQITRDSLTVEDGDFAAWTVSGELAYRVNERLDVAAEVGYSRSEIPAEYRYWVGTDDLPILQTTTLARAPFTVSVKGYLFDRGRAVSRFAWIPSDWSPWLGVGAGGMWYRWEQAGEFVHPESLDVFSDVLRSEGVAPLLQLMGGADVSVGKRLLLTGQARYSWASTALDPAVYQGYEDIDLAGFQATAGIKIRL